MQFGAIALAVAGIAYVAVNHRDKISSYFGRLTGRKEGDFE
jgi:hypothetical protein